MSDPLNETTSLKIFVYKIPIFSFISNFINAEKKMQWIKDHSFISFGILVVVLALGLYVAGLFFPSLNSAGRLGVFQ